MPRAKEGKRKTKGASLPIVPILQKFLKTYEKHCSQSQTSVCPAIRRDLNSSIDSEQSLRKFTLVRPDNSPPSILPVSLEPLLLTIRDERYMLGKEICIWGLQLSNPEIARLPDGVLYPKDQWAMRFGSEEIESIFSGLEKHQRLRSLSLRYCGLEPLSGQRLGSLLSQSAICELYLDGNYLQCSGALALLRPMAEYAEMQGRDQPVMALPDTGNPPQLLQRFRKKVKGLTEAGPWLVKLYLADNGIDGKGGGADLLEFTRTLTW
ncbi:Hypothetical predicted protein [Marmota monax]|uniref:Leucine-rich repeat-containing protein 41 n=1 Tax=Marmota monax TaxID=9995 RepID=A0A5E4B1J6_MARMO|nr:hypothetical protein GHT09_003920 [Marmota monax]VTJ63603.1 Hypothetical predicted protein [Marmota monax]